MTVDRLELPTLRHDEGTPKQVAMRLAAHAIAYEVNRLEDDERTNGWERLQRELARTIAQHMRQQAEHLYRLGTMGLEKRVEEESARLKGYPCAKCKHRHEGSRFGFRCFQCLCDQRPQR